MIVFNLLTMMLYTISYPILGFLAIIVNERLCTQAIDADVQYEPPFGGIP